MSVESLLSDRLMSSSDSIYCVPGYPIDGLVARVSAEPCINEKVALEYALGDSLDGRRSTVIVKNVGMNALADPLVNATAQGLRGGVVIVVGDDLDASKSQVGQDSRYYAEVAMCPLVEPRPDAIGEAVSDAFEASERASRVCILRVTPSLLAEDARPGRCDVTRGVGTVAPVCLTMAQRMRRSEEALVDLFDWASGRPHVTYPPSGVDLEDEGRPFRSEHRWRPPTPRDVDPTPARGGPCDGCPYVPLFESLRGTRLALDTGCCLLSRYPPYGLGDASYGLGSSIAVAARSSGVALTGDYALMHSGVNALIDASWKGLDVLVIVMRNRVMGMTGRVAVPDILKYVSWAQPVTVEADGVGEALEDLLPRKGVRVLVVDGTCVESGTDE